ncbi:MAG: hypothetical protein AB8B65_17565, partial [Kordia sp.]|uniref:hypothetical protein n=1 Tax=Kordia sp. TaxID=1965332 RepID=UPI00385D68AC
SETSFVFSKSIFSRVTISFCFDCPKLSENCADRKKIQRPHKNVEGCVKNNRLYRKKSLCNMLIFGTSKITNIYDLWKLQT